MQGFLVHPERRAEFPVSETNLNLITEYAQSISIPELEEERVNFAAGHKVRTTLIEYIMERTVRNADFPLGGYIEKIGSSWDGSKVGKLDEVDTLFVLDPKHISVDSVAHDNPDICSFPIVYDGKEYSAQQLNEMFGCALLNALDSAPPNDMEHNGYAAPQFSGIRASGPAWTVLFRTRKDIGPMEKGSMVSVDITLALPLSCVKGCLKLDHAVAEISAWIDGIVEANTTKPLELSTEPHLICCPMKGHWKPTTAHSEANVLHEIEGRASIKRAYLLLKCIYRKLEKFISLHDMFQVEIAENGLHARLLNRLLTETQSEKRNLSECLQYGHVLLTPKERKKYNELPKKLISVNTAATKHLLFQKAEPGDYWDIPNAVNGQRTLDLMKDVISEYANSGSFFVDHGIHAGFASICKFSALPTLGDKIGELGKTLLQMTLGLLSADLWDASSYFTDMGIR